MAATLEDLDRRITSVEAQLKGEEPGVGRMSRTVYAIVEETRERVVRLEDHVRGISERMLEVIAENARTRGVLEARMDGIDARLDRMEKGIDNMGHDLRRSIDSVRREFPGLAAEAMRDVLGEKQKADRND